ncbi:hypothetical protein [Mycobacterium sp. E342]|uniref:hypothetical protein n=1 Tax=Mycobacterium sp. E342 TaxID=1834147 RepID=UPI0012E9D8B1|nr:hypothetical protein [Mycobacterium sp. E342]
MPKPSEAPSGEPIAENVELRWPDDMGTEAAVVNQVLFAWDQQLQDAVYMYLGHVAPPPWLTPESAQEGLARMGNTIVIAPRGSFVLNRSRAEELWDALGRHLGKLPPK